ncbi:MAG: hypothetical protein WC635_02515 [Bacteriovorax sp.]|jgi:hypothetical protein
MFKKVTALLLLTAFTNVYAITPVQQARSLDSTFDSLNYKLNVEWDQKDAKFFDSTVAGFEKEIAALQKEGVSTKDLVNYTISKIKDPQVVQEINEMAKVIVDEKMSTTEARAFVVSKLSSTYSHGASWSGSRVGLKCALLVGVIVLILLSSKILHEVEEIENKPEPTHPTPPDYGCGLNYPAYGFNVMTYPIIICEPIEEGSY